MAQQQVFDLFGSDLLAATVDLIFLAPLHGDVTLWINRDQIAGTVKTVGIKGTGIVLRAFVITAEGVRPARHQASNFPLRQWISFGIGNPHFIVRAHWVTLGMDNFLRAIIKTGVVHQPFRHAKHLLQLAANLSGNTRRKRGRKTCAADL